MINLSYCSVYRNDDLYVPIRDDLWMYNDVTTMFEPFYHTARHLDYRLLGQGKIQHDVYAEGLPTPYLVVW